MKCTDATKPTILNGMLCSGGLPTFVVIVLISKYFFVP